MKNNKQKPIILLDEFEHTCEKEKCFGKERHYKYDCNLKPKTLKWFRLETKDAILITSDQGIKRLW